jgi:hypothetical protein
VILHAVENDQTAAWRLDPVCLDLKLVFKRLRHAFEAIGQKAANPSLGFGLGLAMSLKTVS